LDETPSGVAVIVNRLTSPQSPHEEHRMTEYLIAYTGPRGGKPKYESVAAESSAAAAEKFLNATDKTYIVQVYAPVEWRNWPTA
jgi:hypothetical protein